MEKTVVCDVVRTERKDNKSSVLVPPEKISPTALMPLKVDGLMY